MKKEEISDLIFTMSCMIIGIYAYLMVFLSWIFGKKNPRRSTV